MGPEDGGGGVAGRIAAVGGAGEIDVPAGYRRIDLGGRFVLPGFISAHCHLSSNGRPMKLFRLASENEDLARRLVRLLKTGLGKRLVLRMMTTNARQALYSGVTTLRVMGDLADLDVKLRKRIERGQAVGPRLLVSGCAVVPTGGHGDYVGVTADDARDQEGGARQRPRRGRLDQDHLYRRRHGRTPRGRGRLAAFVYQFPMPLLQAWQNLWPVSSVSVKVQVSALVADKVPLALAEALFGSLSARLPEKAVKIGLEGRLIL